MIETRNKIDPNFKNRRGKTPLDNASKDGYHDIVNYLSKINRNHF